MRIARILAVVGTLASAGCGGAGDAPTANPDSPLHQTSKPTDDKPIIDAQGTNQAAKEPVSASIRKRDDGSLVLTYIPKLNDVALADGERLCLVILVGAIDSRLTWQTASAGGDGILGSDGIAPTSVSYSFTGALHRLKLYDSKGDAIRDTVPVQVVLKGLFFAGGAIQYDVRPIPIDKFVPRMKVSAAIGVFNSKDGNYPFLRFISPITCLELDSKSGRVQRTFFEARPEPQATASLDSEKAAAKRPQDNDGARKQATVKHKKADPTVVNQTDEGPRDAAPDRELAANDEPEFRTWIDATGKHRTEAQFIELNGGKVTLKKRDGKVIAVPIEKLSEKDAKYATNQSATAAVGTIKNDPIPRTQENDPIPRTQELEIASNPDKVDFELRLFKPTDSQVSAAGFRVGWYAAEPFGTGDPANPGPNNSGVSPELTGLDNLQNTIAIVIAWKIEAGRNLAPRGIGPHVRGVTEIPDRFKKSFVDGRYGAVAMRLDGLATLVGSKISTGEIDSAFAQQAGIAHFLWFIPAKSTSFELVLPPHKPIAISAKGEDDTDAIFITRDKERPVFKYTVRQMEELKPGEWPALIVFLSRAGGPVLDERIVEAKDRRLGVVGQGAVSANGPVLLAHIAADGSPDLAGYRLTIYDSEAKKVRKGIELVVPFSIFDGLKEGPLGSFGSKPSLDWEWLGREVSLSAGLVAFKTEKGNFVFQRFLGPVASRRVLVNDSVGRTDASDSDKAVAIAGRNKHPGLQALLAASKKYEEAAKQDGTYAFGEALSLLSAAKPDKFGVQSTHIPTFSSRLDKNKLIAIFGEPDESGVEQLVSGTGPTTKHPMVRYGWLRILFTDMGDICGIVRLASD